MSRLETEDEQVQALKDWWKKNGTSLLSGVLVIVLGWSGWTYWENNRIAQASNASAIFEVMQMKSSQNQLGDVLRDGLKLMEDQPESPYSSAVALMIAKYHFDKNEMDQAIENYQWVEQNTTDHSLKFIAQTRLVSVLIQADKLADAEKVLASVSVDTLSAGEQANLDYRMAELAIAQHAFEEAQTRLTKVIENTSAPANIANLARLKLDDLAS